MNTEEAIRRTFGHDTARLREFIKLTEDIFSSQESLATVKFILAKMEAEKGVAHMASCLNKSQKIELLSGAEIQLVENASGKLLYPPGVKLTEREAVNIFDNSTFSIEDGLLVAPFGPCLKFVFLDPALAVITR